ncbi:MAG TPA: lysophospholipid acyltransferase family protein [Acidobacteriaceae bacterium]|nr:lysophospholipid acyltransferase family protein [Acidobacteriaceae bacterium]
MSSIDTSGETKSSRLDGSAVQGSPSEGSCTALKQNFGLRWLTYLLLMPLAALATAIFGSAAMLASIFDGAGRLQHSIARRWAKTLLRIAVSPVQMVGSEHLANLGTAVYVVNHLSYMDTPVLFSKLPFQFRILARHELFRIPFIGWYLQRSGQVAVDSSSLRSSLASLNRGVRILQEGMPLVVFPEGGRSADGQLHPFLSGPAFMAIRAGVPVVPMALIGTYEVMPMHTYHLHPRPLTLVIGEPIPTTEYSLKMAEILTQRLHRSVADLYFQHSPTNNAGASDEQISTALPPR